MWLGAEASMSGESRGNCCLPSREGLADAAPSARAPPVVGGVPEGVPCACLAASNLSSSLEPDLTPTSACSPCSAAALPVPGSPSLPCKLRLCSGSNAPSPFPECLMSFAGPLNPLRSSIAGSLSPAAEAAASLLVASAATTALRRELSSRLDHMFRLDLSWLPAKDLAQQRRQLRRGGIIEIAQRLLLGG